MTRLAVAATFLLLASSFPASATVVVSGPDDGSAYFPLVMPTGKFDERGLSGFEFLISSTTGQFHANDQYLIQGEETIASHAIANDLGGVADLSGVPFTFSIRHHLVGGRNLTFSLTNTSSSQRSVLCWGKNCAPGATAAELIGGVAPILDYNGIQLQVRAQDVAGASVALEILGLSGVSLAGSPLFHETVSPTSPGTIFALDRGRRGQWLMADDNDLTANEWELFGTVALHRSDAALTDRTKVRLAIDLVRDPTLPSVPEPATAFLVCLGLAGLVPRRAAEGARTWSVREQADGRETRIGVLAAFWARQPPVAMSVPAPSRDVGLDTLPGSRAWSARPWASRILFSSLSRRSSRGWPRRVGEALVVEDQVPREPSLFLPPEDLSDMLVDEGAHLEPIVRAVRSPSISCCERPRTKEDVVSRLPIRSRAALACAVLATWFGLTGLAPAARAETDRPSFAEARAIAEEGFVFGLPIVMNYAVLYDFVIDRDSGQWKAPFNQISNEHRVFTYKDTTVVTPNSDTPYSMLWLDLRAEPIVISVPAVDPKRYYSVQLVDGNTFNYGYIGSRATGSEAGDYLVVGPGWQGTPPPGVKKMFRATTDFGLTIFRTQLFDAGDMKNVEAVQAGYKATPLSAYLGKPAPPAPPAVTFPKIDKELVKTGFFEYLDFALQFAPPSPEEEAIRAKLARIGVGPGKSFSFKDLSLEHKAEILLGMKEGEKKVAAKVDAIGKKENGWRVASVFGDRAFFDGDWLLRAAAAKAGIYGNDAVEAVYPMAKTLPDGTLLDGSKHAYTLTFPKGQLPPVNAFWSVTMYDGKTQLLIQNPIDRYLINSPMLPQLKTDADGSLTLYVQKDSPGKDRESNWLPAPDGPIYLVMRLYWPKLEQPSILPPGEGTWQPPALVQAK